MQCEGRRSLPGRVRCRGCLAYCARWSRAYVLRRRQAARAAAELALATSELELAATVSMLRAETERLETEMVARGGTVLSDVDRCARLDVT